MPTNTYTPGAVTTVGDLEVGDTIFLRERRNETGLPTPIAAAVVTELEPTSDGRIDVTVHAAASTPATARSLGALPATREFRLAIVTPVE